jgi:hypothetical protein
MTRYLKRIDGDCKDCCFFHLLFLTCHGPVGISCSANVYRYATHKEILQYRFKQAKKKLTDSKPMQDLGDELCEYCPLEKRSVYSVPGGFSAGCEGSRCSDAYENYLDTNG